MGRGRSTDLSNAAVVNAIARRGGIATRRDLVRDLDVSKDTVHRRLAELVADGSLDDLVAGRVVLHDVNQLPLPDEGREIVSILRAQGLEAHLTGFDLLANRAQQFILEYPHLVYAEPYSLDATEAALVQNGFVVTSPKSASAVRTPDRLRLVILRKQSEAERRYGVTSNIAPLEKAWVDLFREVHNGDLYFDMGEVKQLLTALLVSGADYEKLLRYANRLRIKEPVERLRNDIMHGRS
jgi:hypothetical protein